MYIPFAFENNAFPIEFTFTIDYLIVGGGGCGGKALGGGGGGGGFVSGSALFTSSLNPNLTSSLNYPIVVGLGGVTSSVLASGGDGQSSSFYGITGLGGGGGGGRSGSRSDLTGRDGGSAGGGGFTSPTDRIGGTATQPGSIWGGFGNNGGTGKENVGQAGGAGGGGGAGVAGSSATTGDFINYNPGPGGAGKLWVDGIYYAGGGGGAGDSGGAGGGIGGGGTGGKVTLPQISATRGTDGRGGGGGGGASFFEPQLGKGEGGSGIVKLRYLTNSFYNITGGTITQSGGYTYHTFLSSSTFTINKVS